MDKRGWVGLGVASLVLAGCSSVLSAGAKAEKLELKYEPGQSFVVSTVMDLKQGEGGTPMNMDMSLTSTSTMKVVEKKPDGYAVVEVSVDDVKAQSANAMVSSMVQGALGGMKGSKTTMEIGPTGTIRGATGQAGNLTGLTGMGFPDRPIKVGDTWTTEIDLGKTMPQTPGAPQVGGKPLKVTYKLTSLTPSTAQISLSMTGNADVSGTKDAITIDQKGQMTFDRKLGQVTRSTSTQHQTIKVMGQTMKQTITMDITTSPK